MNKPKPANELVVVFAAKSALLIAKDNAFLNESYFKIVLLTPSVSRALKASTSDWICNEATKSSGVKYALGLFL